MSFLLKDTIHSVLADSVYNEILSRRSNYYYFIGKVIEWENPDVPETPEATTDYEYDTRNSIISVKRIPISDISYVVPRRDWSSGTVYDEYNGNYSVDNPASSGATSLKSARFYVLTPDFNVYKCLFNKNGSASTVSPIGTDALPITTNDGYVWKFMYTLPLSLRNRFLTETFMPVQKSVLNTFYSNGEVDRVVIDNPGDGYSGNSIVTLTVNGTFKGGTGNSIANLIPVFSTTGQFLDVIIKDRGNNYASANISINNAGGTGTGYYNTSSTANLVPILYNNQVDRVVINDPGINYSANIQTTLSLIGNGTNATLAAFVNSAGQLEDVIITNRGSGYTFLDIEVVGDGANANCFVELSVGDLDTSQSTVELSANPGGIYNIKIDNPGNNYSNANVTVSGDGVGFAGNVVLSNTNTISYVEVINPGTGYTYANVVFGGNGTGANAHAIISPQGGHGSNAVKEFFADSIMLYSTINNERNQGIDVNNDYRQFGIIKDIKQFGNNRAFTGTLGSTCFLVELNSVSGLSADKILQFNSDKTREFEIIEIIDSTKQALLLGKNNKTLVDGDVLYDTLTDTTYTIIDVDASPTINKFSGDLVFIDNRTKISYSDQQLVTIRTVIRL
jgi:hypothetical protein